MEETRYLDRQDVADRFGWSIGTVQRKLSAAKDPTNPHPFPEPTVWLSGQPFWSPTDLDAWAESRPGSGRGSRPNRRPDDPAVKLARWRASEAGRSGVLTPYDLGVVLSMETEEVRRSYDLGHLAIKGKYLPDPRPGNRPPRLVFTYAEVARLVTGISKRRTERSRSA